MSNLRQAEMQCSPCLLSSLTTASIIDGSISPVTTPNSDGTVYWHTLEGASLSLQQGEKYNIFSGC